MAKNLKVKGTSVRILSKDTDDYISLTDMAYHKEPGRTAHVIQNWMRNRNTLEFEGFRIKAGLNSFVLTPRQWLTEINAVGIVSAQGRLRRWCVDVNYMQR